MTDTEVRNTLVEVLDKLKIKYAQSLNGDEYMRPVYAAKNKCPDGEVRDTYTISFTTPYNGTMEPRTFYVIIDASTKKVLFIMGSLSFRVVLYHEDGTITTEPGKLKL